MFSLALSGRGKIFKTQVFKRLPAENISIDFVVPIFCAALFLLLQKLMFPSCLPGLKYSV